MRIHNHGFDTEREAQSAQRELQCARCGGALKIHQFGNGWTVLCVQNINHMDLRPKKVPA